MLEYSAYMCNITTSHTAITCYTVPGAGAGLLWTIVIDGQVSRVSTTDYAPPVITGFSGPGATNANTDGGQVWESWNDFC